MRAACGVYAMPKPTPTAPCSRPTAHAGLDLFHFCSCRLTRPGRTAGQQLARIAHHLHAHRNMADARTVVDCRLAATRRIPRLDVADANQLERGRHAIGRFQLVVLRRWPC